MRIHKHIPIAFVLVCAAACSGLSAEEDNFAEIPSGSSLTVKLDAGVDTRATRAGQEVTGTIAEPVIHSGQTVIPAGSPMRGTIASISEDPPAVTVRFEEITVRGASFHLLARPSTTVLTKHSEMRDEGAKIGGGAAAGAVLGGVIGGDAKGAVIGAAAGAAAGTGVALATKARWAYLPAGSTMAVQLEASLQVPVLPPQPVQ